MTLSYLFSENHHKNIYLYQSPVHYVANEVCYTCINHYLSLKIQRYW